MPPEGGHAARCRRLLAALAAGDAGAPLGLAKATSNLFRDRKATPKHRLDLGEFTHVLGIDGAAGTADVEGLASYEALVAATLPHGVMPAVVPQLKTITVGGAAAGVGIEATSFRHGLVHHTMRELEVLLPGGEIVVCTPTNEHADLFHGFPNSYGTLGYALRLVLATQPVLPFVRVVHERHGGAASFFAALAARCDDRQVDFVDGVAFDAGTLVLNTATFADEAPWTSDYGYEHIYWRSLREREVDWLRAADYLWRWDTDWFWCSRNFGAERPWLRRLLGRERLNSRTYAKLMRWNARWGLTRRWARLRGVHPESVIQDVDIPLEHAAEFLAFLLREVGITPVWVCPLREPGAGEAFPLYPLRGGRLYVNFGFWDVVESRSARPPGHYNRLVEHEVARLGGIKSLYSDSFFTPEEFAAAYRLPAYEALKARYDPQRRLLGLYDKCVLRA
ncbi:MAG: FAD-binding protein [Betaproteobacteria bacterium]